jgi:hypothetical protein
MKSSTVRCMGEMKYACRILVRKPNEKKLLGRFSLQASSYKHGDIAKFRGYIQQICSKQNLYAYVFLYEKVYPPPYNNSI